MAKFIHLFYPSPDSKVHGANMGPPWSLSATDGSHVGPMSLAIWVTRLTGFNTPPLAYLLIFRKIIHIVMKFHVHHCPLPRKHLSLNLKQLSGFFFQIVILFSNIVPHNCNISVWNWSKKINVISALWILMAWFFSTWSTRASVDTVRGVYSSISSWWYQGALLPKQMSYTNISIRTWAVTTSNY